MIFYKMSYNGKKNIVTSKLSGAAARTGEYEEKGKEIVRELWRYTYEKTYMYTAKQNR